MCWTSLGMVQWRKPGNVWVSDVVCWKECKAKFGENDHWRIQQLAGTLTLQHLKENFRKLRWFLRTNSANPDLKMNAWRSSWKSVNWRRLKPHEIQWSLENPGFSDGVCKTESQRRRDDNKNKIWLVDRGGIRGGEENRPKMLFVLGNAWMCKLYCREIVLSLRRLLESAKSQFTGLGEIETPTECSAHKIWVSRTPSKGGERGFWGFF